MHGNDSVTAIDEGACVLLGVFPLPFGLLVLPADGTAGEDDIETLRRGALPATLPAAWAFLGPAFRGEVEEALKHLDDSPVGRYDAFVLTGDPTVLGDDLELPPMLRSLSSAAAYFHGVTEQFDLGADVGREGVDDELDSYPPTAAAVLEMVAAAYRIESGQPERALSLLASALDRVRATSPVFAAQIHVQRAELFAPDTPERAVQELRVALDLGRGCALPGWLSDLWLRLGSIFHELGHQRPALLGEAVRAYQEALAAGLTADSRPEVFALVQSRLGLAYLTMPMHAQASQLRPGIAVQSFKKALEIYHPERHPELWASTQLNLANALQYLPSSHPQENLVQAVELYEELLAYRNRAKDPVGHARLLANQANALAHLGMFPPALEKLEVARKLFYWHGENELAEAVLEQVAAIHDRRHEATTSEATVDETVASEATEPRG